MSTLAVGAVMAGAAGAAPGQCSLTGYGAFACDVNTDGAGLTFELPDGKSFAFALEEAGEGLGYLLAADAAPGARPKELGSFMPSVERAGCWVSARDDALQFCAAVEQ